MFTTKRSLYGSDRGTTTSWLAGITAAALIVATAALPAMATDDPTAQDPSIAAGLLTDTQPPAEDPPAEDPPAEDPPAEDPPAEDPPVAPQAASTPDEEPAQDSATAPKKERSSPLKTAAVPLASPATTSSTQFTGLDFVAAAPLTYDHTTGGGAYNDRTVGRDKDIVESLEGGDFSCGDIATFLMHIDLDGTQANPELARTAEFVAHFTLDTTGQTGLALGPVENVEVNYGPVANGAGPGGVDSGISDDGGSAVLSWSQTAPDPTVRPPYFSGNSYDNELVFLVDDLEGSEKLVVRIDVRISCKFGANPTGNMQASIDSAKVVKIGDETVDNTINVGSQTVPFKAAGDVVFPGILIVDKVTVPTGTTDLFDFDVSAPGSANAPAYAASFQLADGTTPWFTDPPVDPSYAMIGNTKTLIAGAYTVSEGPVPVGWDFTSGTCLNQDQVVQGSNGQSITFELDENEVVTCRFTNTRKSYELGIAKTVDASYQIDVDWELTKTADPTSHTGVAGDSFSSDWTITATKTVSDPYGHKVYGDITVTNPSPFDVPFTVSDELSDATAAAVTCPSATVPAGGSVVCTYTASPASASATTNTATVSSSSEWISGPSEVTEPVTFTEVRNGDDSVDLTDPHLGIDETISQSTTKVEEEPFECSSDEADYTEGMYSYSVPNTAYLDGDNTDLEAAAQVDVVCGLEELVATKTALADYLVDLSWELTKTVDPASHSGAAGATFSSDWTITATKTESDPYGHTVIGTVTVTNPSAVARSFSIEDVLNDGTVAVVTCPDTLDNSGTLAPKGQTGDSVTCTYAASPADDSATLNTATVTMGGYANPITATAPVDFTELRNGDDEVDLTDPHLGIDETISQSTTKVEEEPFACSTDEADYTNGTYSYTVPNTANLDGDNTDLEASAEVQITCSLEPLVATKTALADYTVDVSWELAKSVAPDAHSGAAGDSFDSTWTVAATKTESDPYGFQVTGTITVTNPTAALRTFTVDDTLDDGTVAAVSCPGTGTNTATLRAGESTTCTYSAAPADASATLNTATVTMAGFDTPVTATAPVSFTQTRTGDDTVTLGDERIGYSEQISDSTTLPVPETFTCSTDEADYTDGAYSFTEVNTATLLGEQTDLTASAEVTVDCGIGIPELDKTSDPAEGTLVFADDVITYSVTVSNVGGAPISGPVVDTLPDYLSVIDGTISDNGVYDAAAGTITWQVTLAPGENWTFTFDAIVEDTVPDGFELVNEATFLGLEDTTTHPVENPQLEPIEDEEPPVKGIADTGADNVGTLVTTALLAILAGGLMITFGRRRRQG